MKEFKIIIMGIALFGWLIFAFLLFSGEIHHKHEKKTLQGEISALKEDYEKLSAEHINAVHDYESRVEGLRSKNKKLESELTDADKTVKELHTEIEHMKLQLDAQEEEEIEFESASTYVGTYELTAYIETGNPCADGVYPQVGYTVACNDPALWHKWIEIEGYGTYYVHDTGGMANNVIDIYVGDYDTAVQFGRRSANVYVVE